MCKTNTGMQTDLFEIIWESLDMLLGLCHDIPNCCSKNLSLDIIAFGFLVRGCGRSENGYLGTCPGHGGYGAKTNGQAQHRLPRSHDSIIIITPRSLYVGWHASSMVIFDGCQLHHLEWDNLYVGWNARGGVIFHTCRLPCLEQAHIYVGWHPRSGVIFHTCQLHCLERALIYVRWDARGGVIFIAPVQSLTT